MKNTLIYKIIALTPNIRPMVLTPNRLYQSNPNIQIAWGENNNQQPRRGRTLPATPQPQPYYSQPQPSFPEGIPQAILDLEKSNLIKNYKNNKPSRYHKLQKKDKTKDGGKLTAFRRFLVKKTQDPTFEKIIQKHIDGLIKSRTDQKLHTGFRMFIEHAVFMTPEQFSVGMEVFSKSHTPKNDLLFANKYNQEQWLPKSLAAAILVLKLHQNTDLLSKVLEPFHTATHKKGTSTVNPLNAVRNQKSMMDLLLQSTPNQQEATTISDCLEQPLFYLNPENVNALISKLLNNGCRCNTVPLHDTILSVRTLPAEKIFQTLALQSIFPSTEVLSKLFEGINNATYNDFELHPTHPVNVLRALLNIQNRELNKIIFEHADLKQILTTHLQKKRILKLILCKSPTELLLSKGQIVQCIDSCLATSENIDELREFIRDYPLFSGIQEELSVKAFVHGCHLDTLQKYLEFCEETTSYSASNSRINQLLTYPDFIKIINSTAGNNPLITLTCIQLYDENNTEAFEELLTAVTGITSFCEGDADAIGKFEEGFRILINPTEAGNLCFIEVLSKLFEGINNATNNDFELHPTHPVNVLRALLNIQNRELNKIIFEHADLKQILTTHPQKERILELILCKSPTELLLSEDQIVECIDSCLATSENIDELREFIRDDTLFSGIQEELSVKAFVHGCHLDTLQKYLEFCEENPRYSAFNSRIHQLFTYPDFIKIINSTAGNNPLITLTCIQLYDENNTEAFEELLTAVTGITSFCEGDADAIGKFEEGFSTLNNIAECESLFLIYDTVIEMGAKTYRKVSHLRDNILNVFIEEQLYVDMNNTAPKLAVSLEPIRGELRVYTQEYYGNNTLLHFIQHQVATEQLLALITTFRGAALAEINSDENGYAAVIDKLCERNNGYRDQDCKQIATAYLDIVPQDQIRPLSNKLNRQALISGKFSLCTQPLRNQDVDTLFNEIKQDRNQYLSQGNIGKLLCQIFDNRQTQVRAQENINDLLSDTAYSHLIRPFIDALFNTETNSISAKLFVLKELFITRNLQEISYYSTKENALALFNKPGIVAAFSTCFSSTTEISKMLCKDLHLLHSFLNSPPEKQAIINTAEGGLLNRFDNEDQQAMAYLLLKSNSEHVFETQNWQPDYIASKEIFETSHPQFMTELLNRLKDGIKNGTIEDDSFDILADCLSGIQQCSRLCRENAQATLSLKNAIEDIFNLNTQYWRREFLELQGHLSHYHLHAKPITEIAAEFNNQTHTIAHALGLDEAQVETLRTAAEELKQSCHDLMIRYRNTQDADKENFFIAQLRNCRTQNDYLTCIISSIDAIKGKRMHGYQLITTLALVKGYTQSKKLIAQVGTGQGKSLIIAAQAAFIKLTSDNITRVDIMSSSQYLVNRDYDVFNSFYTSLGLVAGKNSTNDNAQINYFTLSQLGNRTTNGLEENGTHSLENYALIIDEVDTIMVDKISSRYIPVGPSEDEIKWIFKIIYDNRNESINTLTERITANPQYPHVSEEMKRLITQKITLFKENARRVSGLRGTATGCRNEDVSYSILNNRLIGINNRTGDIYPFLNGGGYDQFLNLRLGNLDFDSIHLTKAQLSYKYLLTEYQYLSGVSGSVGSERERTQLKDLFQLNCFDVPHCMRRQDQENNGNLRNNVTELTARFEESNNHITKIIEKAKEAANNKQPVLIVTDSNDLAKEIFNTLSREQAPIYRSQLLEAGDNELEAKIGNAGKLIAGKGCISVGTTFCGRGVDYIVDNDCSDTGMLVIGAQFIKNSRDEVQVKGRTGRYSQRGQFHYILNKEDVFTYLENRRVAPTIGALNEKRNSKPSNLDQVAQKESLNSGLTRLSFDFYKNLPGIEQGRQHDIKRKWRLLLEEFDDYQLTQPQLTQANVTAAFRQMRIENPPQSIDHYTVYRNLYSQRIAPNG